MTQLTSKSIACCLALCFALAVSPRPAMAQDEFFNGVTIEDSDTANADLFVTDISVLDGQVCIGNGCVRAEVFDTSTLLKLRSANPHVEFHDTSSSTFPDRAWKLIVNDSTSTGIERFSLEDSTAGTIPVTVEGDAPENALYLTDAGQVGFGTSLPQRKLHIQAGNFPAIRFEQDGSTGLTPQIWDIQGTSNHFGVIDVTAGSIRPFKIYPGQPENLLVMINGQIGIGSSTPSAKVMIRAEPSDEGALVVQDSGFGAPRAQAHFRSRNGIAKLLVEEISTTSSPRTLLELQNNGRPEIVMGNSNTGGEWSFGAGSNFILKQGAIGTDSSVKTKLFEILPNGDATLTGSLTTGGTTCGGGCDRVFAEDYDLPSITEHAEAMFALGHLPNVGPTVENAPINVTDKLGRMLNELEHAHIYIAQLEERLRALEERPAD